jgi:hypothetical protein
VEVKKKEWEGGGTFSGWGGGGGRDLLKGFVRKTLKITEGLRDLDVVGEIKFKLILKNIEWQKPDWIYLALR